MHPLWWNILSVQYRNFDLLTPGPMPQPHRKLEILPQACPPLSTSILSTLQTAWDQARPSGKPLLNQYWHPAAQKAGFFLWNPDWEAKPGLKPKVISLQFVLSSYVFLLNLLVTLALHDCTPYPSATRTECWPSLWWVWMCGKGGASCWHKWSPGISCWDIWGSLTPLFQNEKFQRLPGSVLHG